MTSIITEPRYSMAQGAKLSRVHIAPFWRWYLRGVRGRRLTTRLIGGRRWVYAADLEAFLTVDHGSPRAQDTNVDRRADDAGKLLDALGVSVRSENPRRRDPN
jgi:hypothetical protein